MAKITDTQFPGTITSPPIRFPAAIGQRRIHARKTWRDLILIGLDTVEQIGQQKNTPEPQNP